MRVLRKLTTFYFIGMIFIVAIIVVAIYSFADVYSSTDKILIFTRKLAERSQSFSTSETFQLNQLVNEIGRIQLRAYFFFSVSLLLVSTGLVYLIYTYKRNIVQPLRTITDATRKMAEGRFGELPLMSKDAFSVMKGSEVGTLAENFDSMGHTLRDKIQELKESIAREQNVVRKLNILNEFISSMMFQLNMDEALETISLFSSTLIKSGYSVTLMIDPESRDISRFFSSEPSGKEDILSISKSVLRELNSRGIPVRCSASGDPERFRKILGKEPMNIKNFLAVPIVVKREIQGMFILFNRVDADEFTMNDEDMALTVSVQAALAIEKVMLHEEIVRLAKTDGLTGLNNHRTFHEVLGEEIKRAGRLEKNVALLLIDIDYFKGFNDTHGHQEGDAALRRLSNILNRSIRKIDSAARYGGEEFSIILAESSYNGGIRVAEKIRSEISSSKLDIKGKICRLSVSIGVAVFPDDSLDKDGLIKAADDALYMAKKTGRNRVVTFRQYKEEVAK